MNTRLREIVDEIENARAKLYASVENLSQEELDKQPGPGIWSPGEILYHLYLSETGITTLLDKQVARARKRNLGLDPEDSSLLGSLDHFALEKAETKVKAPSRALPQKDIKKKEMIELLQNSRKELLEKISEASPYNLSELEFPHPLLGRMDMYRWILFIGKHEERHTNQLTDAINTP
jgi:hypothetical protein